MIATTLVIRSTFLPGSGTAFWRNDFSEGLILIALYFIGIITIIIMSCGHRMFVGVANF